MDWIHELQDEATELNEDSKTDEDFEFDFAPLFLSLPLSEVTIDFILSKLGDDDCVPGLDETLKAAVAARLDKSSASFGLLIKGYKFIRRVSSEEIEDLTRISEDALTELEKGIQPLESTGKKRLAMLIRSLMIPWELAAEALATTYKSELKLIKPLEGQIFGRSAKDKMLAFEGMQVYENDPKKLERVAKIFVAEIKDEYDSLD